MDERLRTANQIVQNRIWWSIGGGLIPVPWVDVAAVSGIQVSMIASLAKHYGVPFSKNTAKTIVAALLGSIVPSSITNGAIGNALKAVPVLGSTLGTITMSAFSGAATYAIGKVFIQHFETGGTLLDFDIDNMRGFFKSEFETGTTKAQQVAAEAAPAAKPAAK